MAADLLTERLRLVPWSVGHETFLAGLMAQPAMMRFIGAGVALRPEDVRERSTFATAHWMARGWGWRVPVLRETDEPIGIVSANRLGEGTVGFSPDEHEIGWFIGPDHQGQGLAVEASRAVLEEILGPVGAPSAIARIQPANAPSVRVADALEMRFERETTGRLGEPVAVYRRRA